MSKRKAEFLCVSLSSEGMEELAALAHNSCGTFPMTFFGSRAQAVRNIIATRASDPRATCLCLITAAHTVWANNSGGHLLVIDVDDTNKDNSCVTLIVGPTGGGKSKAIDQAEKGVVDYEAFRADEGTPVTIRITNATSQGLGDTADEQKGTILIDHDGGYLDAIGLDAQDSRRVTKAKQAASRWSSPQGKKVKARASAKVTATTTGTNDVISGCHVSGLDVILDDEIGMGGRAFLAIIPKDKSFSKDYIPLGPGAETARDMFLALASMPVQAMRPNTVAYSHFYDILARMKHHHSGSLGGAIGKMQMQLHPLAALSMGFDLAGRHPLFPNPIPAPYYHEAYLVLVDQVDVRIAMSLARITMSDACTVEVVTTAAEHKRKVIGKNILTRPDRGGTMPTAVTARDMNNRRWASSSKQDIMACFASIARAGLGRVDGETLTFFAIPDAPPPAISKILGEYGLSVQDYQRCHGRIAGGAMAPPPTGFGDVGVMGVAASASPATHGAPHQQDLRLDPTTGEALTREQFLARWQDDVEWHAATPADDFWG